MKKMIFPVLLLLLISQTIFAQFESLDAQVRQYPAFTDADKLSARINTDFDSDVEKARAIYTWIATNIHYDMKAFYAQQNGGIAFSYTTPEDRIEKERAFRLNLVKKTMRSKKAICEGYASLFTYLCAMTDLEAVIIPGTSKTSYTEIGKIPSEGDHTWNAVMIDGRWQLIDVTWAAGVVKGSENTFTPYFNDAYFCTDPDRFFLNHYPDDKRWLLTDKSPRDFAELPFYYPTYLKNDYHINADKGAIIFPKNAAVRFKIENLNSGDELYYITGKDNVLDRLHVDENHNFVIPPSAKLSGYLTLFVNMKPLVSYKIIRG